MPIYVLSPSDPMNVRYDILKAVEEYVCNDRAKELTARHFQSMCSANKIEFYELFPLEFLEDAREGERIEPNKVYTIAEMVIHDDDPLFLLDKFLCTLRARHGVEIPCRIIHALDRLFSDDIEFYKEEYLRDPRHNASEIREGLPAQWCDKTVSYIEELRSLDIPTSHLCMNAWWLFKWFMHIEYGDRSFERYDEMMYQIRLREKTDRVPNASLLRDLMKAQSAWQERRSKIFRVVFWVNVWKRQRTGRCV
jgi:hypothetical protein